MPPLTLQIKHVWITFLRNPVVFLQMSSGNCERSQLDCSSVSHMTISFALPRNIHQ